MKLSKLIEEFIEMKVEGEPPTREWRSIAECAAEREHWNDRLQELRDQIDGAIEAAHAKRDA